MRRREGKQRRGWEGDMNKMKGKGKDIVVRVGKRNVKKAKE